MASGHRWSRRAERLDAFCNPCLWVGAASLRSRLEGPAAMIWWWKQVGERQRTREKHAESAYKVSPRQNANHQSARRVANVGDPITNHPGRGKTGGRCCAATTGLFRGTRLKWRRDPPTFAWSVSDTRIRVTCPCDYLCRCHFRLLSPRFSPRFSPHPSDSETPPPDCTVR